MRVEACEVILLTRVEMDASQRNKNACVALCTCLGTSTLKFLISQFRLFHHLLPLHLYALSLWRNLLLFRTGFFCLLSAWLPSICVLQNAWKVTQIPVEDYSRPNIHSLRQTIRWHTYWSFPAIKNAILFLAFHSRYTQRDFYMAERYNGLTC